MQASRIFSFFGIHAPRCQAHPANCCGNNNKYESLSRCQLYSILAQSLTVTEMINTDGDQRYFQPLLKLSPDMYKLKKTPKTFQQTAFSNI